MRSKVMIVLALAVFAIMGRTCSAQFSPEYMQRMQLMAVQSTTLPKLDTYKASSDNCRITVAAFEAELQTALNTINAAPAGALKTAATTARSNAALAVSQFRTESIKERQIYTAFENLYQSTDRAIANNQLGLAATNQTAYPGYDSRWFSQNGVVIITLTAATSKLELMRTTLAALR